MRDCAKRVARLMLADGAWVKVYGNDRRECISEDVPRKGYTNREFLICGCLLVREMTID